MSLYRVFKLAFRNIFRNKRRTLLTLAAIIIGGVALVFIGGYIQYTFWGLREQTIHSQTGHMQFYKKGFIEKGSIEPEKYLLSKNEAEKVEEVLSKQKHVKQFAKRLSIMGLVSNGDKSVIFLGKGVEPEKDSEINTNTQVVEGENLMDDDNFKILLGVDLASLMHVKIGDNVTLLVTTMQGSQNAYDFTVKGFTKTGIKDYDDKSIVVSLTDAQKLINTDSIERIISLFDKTENTELVNKELSGKIDSIQVEFRTWEQLAQYYHQVVQMYENAFNVMKTVILLIIIMSIANALIMSVMERVSEIGTLRAMGTSKGDVLVMFIMEGFTLGVLGGIGSVIFGWLFAFLINLKGGIYMPPPPGHTEGYWIQIMTNFKVLALPFIISVLASVISSFIPAVKAARLKVVEALYHV